MTPYNSELLLIINKEWIKYSVWGRGSKAFLNINFFILMLHTFFKKVSKPQVYISVN